MKTLFSDRVIAALRKVPTFVWFLILAASCFFMNCYASINEVKLAVNTLVDAFNTQGLNISINVTAYVVMSCIFEGLLNAVILELIFYFVYGFVIRGFLCAVNRKDFSFRVRILVILWNVILGLFNLIAFAWNQGANLLSALTSVAVPAILMAWFYEDFRVRYVAKRSHAKLFGKWATLYLGIVFVLRVIDVFQITLNVTSSSVLDNVAVFADLGITVVVMVLAYLNYKRLQKIESEPEDNDLFIPKEPENNTIFKDLGF